MPVIVNRPRRERDAQPSPAGIAAVDVAVLPRSLEGRLPMDFAYSPKVEALRELLRTFMDRHVVPRLGDWPREVEAGVWPPSMIEPLREQARAEGPWHEVLPSLPRVHSSTSLSRTVTGAEGADRAGRSGSRT